MNKLNELMVIPLLTLGDVLDRLEKLDQDPQDLILAIDLSQQDADFTIATIKKLFESLCGDLEYYEAKELLKELKQINKEKRK